LALFFSFPESLIGAFIFFEKRPFFGCNPLKQEDISHLALFSKFSGHLAHNNALKSFGFVWLCFSPLQPKRGAQARLLGIC
jgi:hypothetical protein